MSSEFLDVLARTQCIVRFFNPRYHKYLFVSNDKKGRDHVIEAHENAGDARNGFMLQKSSDDGFLIFNPSRCEWVFVSNDIETGDNVVESHKYQGEARNAFRLIRVGLGGNQYKVFNPAYGKYVFVSDDIYGGDNVVEAHHHENEDRNVFELILPDVPGAAFRRWRALGEPRVDDWSGWLGATRAESTNTLPAYQFTTRMLVAGPPSNDFEMDSLFENLTRKTSRNVKDNKGNSGVKTVRRWSDGSVTITVRLHAPDGSIVHNSTRYISTDRNISVVHTIEQKPDGAFRHVLTTFKRESDGKFWPFGEICQYDTRAGDWRIYDYQCEPLSPDATWGEVTVGDMLEDVDAAGHAGGHAGGGSSEGAGHSGGVVVVHVNAGGGGGGGGRHGVVTILDLN